MDAVTHVSYLTFLHKKKIKVFCHRLINEGGFEGAVWINETQTAAGVKRNIAVKLTL